MPWCTKHWGNSEATALHVRPGDNTIDDNTTTMTKMMGIKGSFFAMTLLELSNKPTSN